ncbi:MAG: acyl-CoA dehydrogenase family protein [Acidimicrobiales bacterium]
MAETQGDGAPEVSEGEFRAEAEGFLGTNARLKAPGRTAFGEGSDEVSLFPERSSAQEAQEVAEAMSWARKVFDAGFGWITGPRSYGGRGLPRSYEALYRSLEARYETPSQAPRLIGLGMVAPTILAHGTEAAKRKYLRALYRGEIIACQLFSEPAAGSDLASIRTRAVRDGDEWVVTGQKVWTSGAQYSEIGEILCRSDTELPKHGGISAFIVDMTSPGVEVRPLRQMTGGASFNEVFFTDVSIPADHLLGEVNGGWTVALTTLMNERAAIGGGGAGSGSSGSADLSRLVALAQHLGLAGDPLIRQEIADTWIKLKVAHYNHERAMASIRSGGGGRLPGPELSIAKLTVTENLRRTAALAAHILGPRITADSGEWGTFAWSKFLLGVPGMRVAGGTDEVMRNILGERVLGLPREPRESHADPAASS